MSIAPIIPQIYNSQTSTVSFQKRKERDQDFITNRSSNTPLKIAATAAGIGLLAAGAIYTHKAVKYNQYFKKLTSAMNSLFEQLKEIPQKIVNNNPKPINEIAEELPVGIPDSVKSYSPISISQRIAQYRQNAAKLIEKETSRIADRGTVQTLPLEKFHRWEKAAKKLSNVTKQAPSDTYKSLKICLNTFKERYGLKDSEIGFIKEAMNMFADRTKMALASKENVDARILNKQILPEQLFAEKISSALIPALEKDNAAVIQKLLTTVSKTIDF